MKQVWCTSSSDKSTYTGAWLRGVFWQRGCRDFILCAEHVGKALTFYVHGARVCSKFIYLHTSSGFATSRRISHRNRSEWIARAMETWAVLVQRIRESMRAGGRHIGKAGMLATLPLGRSMSTCGLFFLFCHCVIVSRHVGLQLQQPPRGY